MAKAQLVIAPNYLKLGNKQNYDTYTNEPPIGNNISVKIINHLTTFDNIIQPNPNENIIHPIHIIVLNFNTLKIIPSPNK